MDLYTRLYGHRASDNPPTQRQLASQTNPINAAKQVLPQAEDMAKQYPEQVDDEELQKMIEEMEDSNEEAEGRMQAASEGGEATELLTRTNERRRMFRTLQQPQLLRTSWLPRQLMRNRSHACLRRQARVTMPKRMGDCAHAIIEETCHWWNNELSVQKDEQS